MRGERCCSGGGVGNALPEKPATARLAPNVSPPNDNAGLTSFGGTAFVGRTGALSGMMEAPLAQQQQQYSLSQLNYNNNNNSHGGPRRPQKDAPASATSSCTDSVLLQDGGDELQWCADYPFNREFQRHLCSSSLTSSGRLMRRSILSVSGDACVIGDDGGSLGGVDLSYEDLSKNFDANLAEIDMETFRSEDIHAILTLPVLYGGDFQSASRGEQCASVSGSFLEALPLDASSVHKVESTGQEEEEDSGEMSICRDEPLFSPVKECGPPLAGTRGTGAGGALSTDSLDCSSYEEHDLVLTCQANKDNYTIAFQQSGTHFSDDLSEGSVPSDQQSHHSGSSAASAMPACGGPGSMARSELSFTTWHRLRSSGVRLKPEADQGKSQSLPNLLRRSAAVAGRMDVAGSCLPLYTLQASTHGTVDPPDARSVSLLRLFMRSKAGSGGSLSSSHSENSDSVTTPRDGITAYQLQSSSEDSSGSMDSKSDSSGEEPPLPKPVEPLVRKVLRASTNTVGREANNNNVETMAANDNERLRMVTSESEEETSASQCFEDSLVEAAQPRMKPANARSPIHEEEEPFESSGDETMKDSHDLLSSGGGTSSDNAGIVERRNNDVNSSLRCAKGSSALLGPLGKERIKNVFSTGNKNSNAAVAAEAGDRQSSRSTQTKRFNCSDGSGSGSTRKVSDSSGSGEEGRNARSSSLLSSGYVSRQNSVDQIHRQTFLLSAGGNRRKQPPTAIARMRHSSTQVPVHIRDRGIQTSVEGAVAENSNWLYTVDDSSAVVAGQRSFNLTLRPQEGMGGVKDDTEPKRSIYVCYPNYSLPDLSFLKELAAAEDKPDLVLRPTQHKMPQPETADGGEGVTAAPSDGSPALHRRTHSSEPHWRRPKSCNDFEDLSRRNLSHIQDWDSLSVLLPAEVKAMVSHFRHAAPPNPAGVIPEQRGILRKVTDEANSRPRSQCDTLSADAVDKGVGSIEFPNRRHSLQDYRRLLKGLPDMEGLLPPCPNLACSMTGGGLQRDSLPLSRTNSEGSWRRSGGRGTRRAMPLGATCSTCRAKKAVSFSEDLNIHTNDARTTRGTFCKCTCGSSPTTHYGSLERPSRKMTLLFGGSQDDQHATHEFAVSPKGLSPSWGMSPLSRSQRELIEQKRGLLDSTMRSTKQVLDCYSTEKESQPSVGGGPEPCLSEGSACGRLAIEFLVPALRELLSDGLLPHVRGVFGRLPNSLWHLAHSLSQAKEGRKEVQELVEYIEQADTAFHGDGEKFGACLLGLLNLGCLDTWFLTLLSSPQILQKHYQMSAAFVPLLSHPSLFFLREELACSLRSLSELPFGFSLSFALGGEAQSLKPTAKPSPASSSRKSSSPPSGAAFSPCTPSSDENGLLYDESDDLRTVTCQSLVDSSSLEETLDNSSRVLELQKKLKGGTGAMVAATANGGLSTGTKALYPAMQKVQGSAEEMQRFRQLRNHWEQMSHASPSSTEAAATTATTSSAKLASPTKLPSPTKTIRKPAVTSGAATKKSQAPAADNRRLVPRGGTPGSRTPSPNISAGGRPQQPQQQQQRRSLIPVHRGWKKPATRQGASEGAK
ncbi:uncharacterized protein LOC144093943 isoform X2 [Amblyomma americanum]